MRLLLTATCILAMASFGLVGSAHANDFENTLLQKVNEARITHGSSTLNRNEKLSQAALKKAEALVEARAFQHTLPSGKNPWVFLESEDYDFLLAGENLGRNHSSPPEVVEGWLNSPSHKANMLRRDYTDTGIAAIQLQSGYLTVMYYAKPMTANMQVVGSAAIFNIDTPLLFPLMISIFGIAGYSFFERKRPKNTYYA